MSFSELIDRTIRLYRASFSPLIGIAALTGILQLPVAFVVAQMKPGVEPDLRWALTFLGAMALAVFAYPLQYGALTKAGFDVIEGRSPTVVSALRVAMQHYWAILASVLLAALATGGGLLLLIVPGIYIMLGFGLATVAIVSEGLGPIAGLRRSWRLASGRRGRIFGVLSVWTVITLVISYGLSGLMRLVGVGDMAAQLAQSLSSVFVMPTYCISLALILIEARDRLEGADLEREAERLARAAPGAPAV